MRECYSRRSIISAFSVLIGMSAGCGDFFANNRTVAFSVINHTGEYIEVELKSYKDDDLIMEQNLNLPGEHPDPDRVNPSSLTQIHSTELNKGDEIEVEVIVKNMYSKSYTFSIGCDINNQVVGDIITFRVHEDHIVDDVTCLTRSA